MCVGQAVPSLTVESITPDFVIVTDPVDHSDVMKGFDFDKCNGLICSELIHPNFLSLPFKSYLSIRLTTPSVITKIF